MMYELVDKDEFDLYIYNILKPSNGNSLQNVKFELDPALTPDKWLELITKLNNDLRNDVFPLHLVAAKEIQYRYHAIQLYVAYLRNHLKVLKEGGLQIEKKANNIDSKCEDILRKHEQIKERLNGLLEQLNCNSFLTDDEVKMKQMLGHANSKLISVEQNLKKLCIKNSNCFSQVKELKSDEYFTKPHYINKKQTVTIKFGLEAIQAHIINLAQRTKIAKLEARNLM